jgi:hypothetical protein
MSTVAFPDIYTCNALIMCGLHKFSCYTAHTLHTNSSLLLWTRSVLVKECSPLSPQVCGSPEIQSVTYNSYVKSLYCLWLAQLVALWSISYCLSGVTSIMTVGRVRGWLYTQTFCYSSPSPGTLVVWSILCQRNEYAKTYKCPKNHKAMCMS